MKNKKFILYLTVIISIPIIAYLIFITQKERIKDNIKKTLIYNIEDKLNCKIRIGKIEKIFFNKIILNKISVINVTNNSIIKINKIALKYNLWDYLSKKSKKLRIHEVKLYDPYICLTKDEEQGWNWKGLLNFKRIYSKEYPKIITKNGLLHLIDSSHNLDITLQKINFLFNPEVDSFPFVLNSILEKEGKIYFAGNIDRLRPLTTNFKLIFNNIDIKKFEKLPQNYIERINKGYLSGKITGLVNETNQGKYYLSYKGRCKLSKGNFKPHYLQDFLEDVSLEGNFKKSFLDKEYPQFSPSLIHLKLQKAFYKKIPFSGFLRISSSFTKINLSSCKVALQDLSKILNLNEKSLIFEKIKEARGDLIVEACYKKEENSWQGDINYQNLLTSENNSLPSIFTKFKYKDNKINLFSQTREKGIFLSGKINLQKNPSLKINLQFRELLLQNILTIFKLNPKKFFGPVKLSGYFNIEGNFNKFNYKSLLKADNKKTPFKQPKLIFEGTYKKERKNFWQVAANISLNNLSIYEHLINSEIIFQGQREEANTFKGQLRMEKTTINDVDLGYSDYEIYWQNNILKINTLSSKIGIFLKSSFQLDKERLLEGQIDLNDLDASLIIHAFKLKKYTPLKTCLFGKIRLVKKPSQYFLITSEGLKLKNVSFKEYNLNNLIVSFSYIHENLQIINLATEDQMINIAGNIQLRNFQAEEVNLILNTKLLPLYHGKLNSALNISKKNNTTEVSGNADLIFKESQYSLQNIKAKIKEDKKDIIKIAEFVSKVNKTSYLNMDGEINKQKEDMNLNFQMKNFPISNLPFSILAKSSGNLNIKGSIKDSIKDPQVSFNFKTNLLKINNKLFRDFTGEANFTKDKILKFKTIDLAKKISLEGNIDLKKTQKIDACLLFNDEKAVNLLKVFTPLKKVSGILSGKVLIKEKINNPKLFAELKIKNLEALKIQANRADIEFCYFNKTITLQKVYLTQRVGFLKIGKGSISLDSKENSFLNINLKNFRFPGTLLSGKIKLFSKNNPYESECHGRIRTTDLIFNKKLKIKSICSQFLYKKDTLYLSSYNEHPSILGKITFLFPDKIIIDELCYAKNKAILLKASGNIVPKTENIDINLQAFDPMLKVIPEYTETINSIRGKIVTNLNIKGTFNQYHINGNLNLEKGEVVTSWKYFNKYTDIQAEIIFKDYQVILKKLKFNLNEGVINSYGDFIISEGKMNIYLSTEKFIEVYVPSKIDTKLLANLNVNGSCDTPICKGTIELFDTDFTYTKKLRKRERNVFDNVFFNLKLLAKSKVKYYNDYTKCNIIDGSWIELSGYPEKFKIVGLIESHKGYLEYLGTRFLINQAKLEFREDEQEPYLFGEAQANVANTLILMNYQGKLFVSEPMLTTPNTYPPKTKDEIVGMLRLGRDYKGIKNKEINALLRVGLAKVLGAELNSNIIRPLESNLAKLLKVDVDIRIPYLEKAFLKKDKEDSQELKEDITTESIFSFGKYLTDDLYFNYRGALSNKKESILSQEFELEYYYKHGEILKYKYLPKSNGREKKGHEISIEKEIKF